MRPPRRSIHYPRQSPRAPSPLRNPHRGFPHERRGLDRHLGPHISGTDVGEGRRASCCGTGRSRRFTCSRVAELAGAKVSVTAVSVARHSLLGCDAQSVWLTSCARPSRILARSVEKTSRVFRIPPTQSHHDGIGLGCRATRGKIGTPMTGPKGAGAGVSGRGAWPSTAGQEPVIFMAAR